MTRHPFVSFVGCALMVACAPADDATTTDPHELVSVAGVLPQGNDEAEVLESFVASGAEFGFVMDPVTGDTFTMHSAKRFVFDTGGGGGVNSSSYTLADAVCLDCTGCTVGGVTRTVRVDLFWGEPGVGSTFGYQPISSSNFSPNDLAAICAIDGNFADLCPGNGTIDPGDSVALVLPGTVASCGEFSYFFDTTGG